MSPAERLNVSQEALAAVCARFRVRELAVFGSAARGDARADSDVDLLVLFDEKVRVSLFTLIDLQVELSDLFKRPVDLVPKDGLKPALKDEVLSEAEVLYAA
jgi:predicted nucleotidyltransferase